MDAERLRAQWRGQRQRYRERHKGRCLRCGAEALRGRSCSRCLAYFAERRVALLTLYGMGRYVADSKSVLVDEVPDDCPGYDTKRPSDGRVYPYGLRGAKLWRRVNSNGDVVQAVELKNSTVEVGGRRKTFFIGVSAKAASVEEAVAWSYGFERAADYYPESES